MMGDSFSFKLELFEKYLEKNDGHLKVNDVVGITFSELDLALQARQVPGNQQVTSSFVVQDNITAQEYSADSPNAMFRIENFDESKPGGFLEWDKPYRLKHLAYKSGY